MMDRSYLSTIYKFFSLGTEPVRFVTCLVFTLIAYSGAVIAFINEIQTISIRSYGAVAAISTIVLGYVVYRIGQRVLSPQLGSPLGTLASITAHLGLSSLLLGFANIIMRGSVNATVQFVVNNPLRTSTYIIVYSLFFVVVLYTQASFQSRSEHSRLQDLLQKWLEALDKVKHQEQLDRTWEAADEQLTATSWELVEELDDADIQGGTKLQADLRSWVSKYEEQSVPVREKIITGESDKESRRILHRKLIRIRRQINSFK